MLGIYPSKNSFKTCSLCLSRKGRNFILVCDETTLKASRLLPQSRLPRAIPDSPVHSDEVLRYCLFKQRDSRVGKTVDRSIFPATGTKH